MVSRHTAEIFEKMGIETFFYAIHVNEQEWKPFASPLISTILLPDSREVFTPQNVDYLCQSIQERGISLLLLPVSYPSDYHSQLSALGIKLIYWLHNTPFWEVAEDLQNKRRTLGKNFWMRLRWRLLLRQFPQDYKEKRMRVHKQEYLRVLEHVDRMITLCPAYSQELIEELQLSPEQSRKLVSILNTIDLPEAPCLEKEKLIIFMGRIARGQKNPFRLVQIWAKIHDQLPDWQVEIHGSGPDAQELEAMIQRLQLPRIRFCGYCSDPAQVYQRAAILALVSEYEGWALALVEAQSYGVVPIAFSVCAGNNTIIGRDMQYGRLVTPFSLEEYEQKLLELCQGDKYKELQAPCLQKSKSYAHEQNYKVWQKLLEEL